MRETILVVRPGALGDTILTLPLLKSIADKHPAAEITFLGTRAYLDLLPDSVKAEAIGSPRWLWLFQDATCPGDRGWDVAYVVLGRPEFLCRRLAATGTKIIKTASSTPVAATHIVESMHQGLQLPVRPKRPTLLHRAPAQPRRDIIWVHPGSGGPKKCAPLGLIASYAAEASNRAGLPVAITLGEADDFVTQLDGWGALARLASITYENRPLSELCEKLGGAALFFGNDSGMSHFAANLGVPATVFFVSTDPVQWAPWVPTDRITVIDLRVQQSYCECRYNWPIHRPSPREPRIGVRDRRRGPVPRRTRD